MTLTELGVLDWSVAPLTAHDHSPIADFLATTDGLHGRKFAADSRDIAEQLGATVEGSAVTLRDETGHIRGYVALHRPHGEEPEYLADFVFHPDTPPNLVDDVVADTVAVFTRSADAGAYLRAIIGTDQQAAIDALLGRGARREAEFIRTRKTLHDEDVAALAAYSVSGVDIVPWAEVLHRGLEESVRRLQYDTFSEHFGNMSKTPQDWRNHLGSRSFAPDFSIAAVDGAGDVLGYVLGSVFTAGANGSQERSAHTDYIGVRADQRKRGIGELMLRKIWLSARERGLLLASLGTDINNRSNAHLLYRRLGYLPVETQFAYRIETGENTK